MAYQVRITALQSKLEVLQGVIRKEDLYIGQLGKQLSKTTDNLSTIVSSAISHDKEQYQSDINNKDKLLMRLVNLHSSSGSFHNFNSLKNDRQSMQRKRCIKFVESMLMNNTNALFGGILKDVVINSVTKYYKETIFNPFILLKKMDQSNHVLSLSAIELLRSMVPVAKNSHNNLFPSSSAIQLVAAIVSKRGKLEVPYVSDHLPSSLGGGEQVCWDVAKVLKLVVVATGLSDRVKT
jgi:hypothetical protein